MDNVTIVLIIVAVAVLGIVFRFRRRVMVSLEAFGVKFKAEGEGVSLETGGDNAGQPQAANKANVATATGERSVAVGGNMTGGSIDTGDKKGTGSNST